VTTIPAASVAPDCPEPDQGRLRKLGRKVRARLDANKSVRRIPVANAEVWAVGQFFDAVECGRLISIIDEVAKPSVAPGYSYSSGLRTSYSGDVDPLDPFICALQQRIDKLLGIDPAHGETIQGQRYEAGQEFKQHTDWFPPGSPIVDRERQFGGQRAFTAMAYLNTVEEGGETDFPHLDIAIAPRPGTLLIWNNADPQGVPNPWTIHAGLPVTRGVKYIITKWYRARKWQAH
jgi:prolyl 4-hydroxylase